MTVHVANNLTTTVDNVDMRTTVSSGNAYHTVATGTFTELVQSDVLQTYNASKTEHVDCGPVTETFLSQMTTIATTQELSTGATMTVTSGALHTVNSDASYVHNITGDTTVTTSANTTFTTTGNTTNTTTGNTLISTTGTTTIDSTGALTLSTPAHMTTKAASEERTILGMATKHQGSEILLTTGEQLQLTLALKQMITAGVLVNLNLALNFEATPLKHQIQALKQDNVGCKILDAGIKLHMEGLAEYVTGLFSVT